MMFSSMLKKARKEGYFLFQQHKFNTNTSHSQSFDKHKHSNKQRHLTDNTSHI